MVVADEMKYYGMFDASSCEMHPSGFTANAGLGYADFSFSILRRRQPLIRGWCMASRKLVCLGAYNLTSSQHPYSTTHRSYFCI